jgi:hypothetical protein
VEAGLITAPSAANASWASFGLLKATAADIERTWITGRAIMPALAGLLLSMAVMTWPRRTQGPGRKAVERAAPVGVHVVDLLDALQRLPSALFETGIVCLHGVLPPATISRKPSRRATISRSAIQAPRRTDVAVVSAIASGSQQRTMRAISLGLNPAALGDQGGAFRLQACQKCGRSFRSLASSARDTCARQGGVCLASLGSRSRGIADTPKTARENESYAEVAAGT